MEYTVDRFWSGVPASHVQDITTRLRERGELDLRTHPHIPDEALPCLVMLAAWGRKQGKFIVRDFHGLVELMETAFKKSCKHPDSFFVSSICIMYRRDQEVSIGGFESFNIPDIYEQIMGHTPATAVEKSVGKASKPARMPDELDSLLAGATTVDQIIVAALQHPLLRGYNKKQLQQAVGASSVAVSNPGLQRMQIRNRLRSLVKRGGIPAPAPTPPARGKGTGKAGARDRS